MNALMLRAALVLSLALAAVAYAEDVPATHCFQITIPGSETSLCTKSFRLNKNIPLPLYDGWFKQVYDMEKVNASDPLAVDKTYDDYRQMIWAFIRCLEQAGYEKTCLGETADALQNALLKASDNRYLSNTGLLMADTITTHSEPPIKVTTARSEHFQLHFNVRSITCMGNARCEITNAY